jgi:hypothetical protein
MLYPAFFAIVVGLIMIVQWSFFYFSNQIPELENEPVRIGFHIVAEVVTALSLVAGGVALLAELDWGVRVYHVSLGMLFYTAIVSPGYFAQKGDWKWLGIFSVLIAGGLVGLLLVD